MKPDDVMKLLSWIDVASNNMGCATLSRDEVQGILALLREKDAEIERLKGALKVEERHNELTMGMAKKALANARANNVSEIKTRFAMRYGTYTGKDMTPITEVFRILDQIANERLEANE